MPKFKITQERTREGKRINFPDGNEFQVLIVETRYPPKVGEGYRTLMTIPTSTTIIKVEDAE